MAEKKSTLIIAEAGVNHGGDYETAVRMIHSAKQAGADYIKFQTFKAENLVCRSASRAEYQRRNCGGEENQFEMLKRLELDFESFTSLKDECAGAGIGFLSSPFDLESIDFLSTLGMDFWKIPSGEITNLPYLERIASKGGRVIMSTGMCSIDEVKDAIHVLTCNGIPRNDIALLHCNTQYPTPVEDVNLRAMETLRKLGCGMTGFSDHTVGTAIPVAAVALGAEIIEKHFTLDKNAAGPDHIASADPAELAAMVRAIRDVESGIGSPLKHVTESESGNVAVARKSIVASRFIGKGETLSEENLTVKRPGNGLSPMLWHRVIGTKAVRDFNKDDLITV